MAQYRVRVRAAGDEAMDGSEGALSGAVLRRFLLRAGFLSSSARAEREAREFLCAFLRKLAGSMLALAQHDRRAGFRLHDVLRACAHFGITVYGYDDLVVLPSPDKRGHDEVFHVTELVECPTTFSRSQQQQEAGEPDLEPARARLHRRTDFVTNYATWERDEDDECSDPELSDWSCFSDSEMEPEGSDSDEQSDRQQQQQQQQQQHSAGKQSPWRESTAEGAVRPWHRGKTDEDKFVDALRSAQQVVDAELVVEDEPEMEEMEADAPLGQGYYSDCDSVPEHAAIPRRRRLDLDEDALWDTSDDIHDLDTSRSPVAAASAAAAAFEDNGNQYIMARASFAALFQTILRESMHVGELSISSVALSALHNTSEQYLHRSLSEESSLRYKLQAVLMEHEFVRATTHLETQLQAEREKVTAHEQALCALRAALTAKEREMQQQIAQLQRQVAAAATTTPSKRPQRQRGESSDVEMTTPTPKKRKKSPAKQRKVTSKTNAQVVRKSKTPPKPSRASQSLVGSLRTRLQDLSRSKKAQVNPV